MDNSVSAERAREALAALADLRESKSLGNGLIETLRAFIDKARGSIAGENSGSPAGAGEPVAWAAANARGGVEFGKGWMFAPTANERATIPLYTSPQPAALVGELRAKVSALRDEVNYQRREDFQEWGRTSALFDELLAIINRGGAKA